MAPPLHRAIQSPAKFADSVDAYIAACLAPNDNGRDSDVISIAGCSLALGCHRDMINRWKEQYGEPTGHDPDCLISSAIKKLEESGERQLERMAILDRNSMALAMGKIKHGWIEAQHVKVEAKVSGSIEVVTGVTKGED